MALPKIQYRRTASGKWQRKALSSGKWYYVAESAMPREENEAETPEDKEEEEEEEEVVETARERAKREAARRRREREEMQRQEREEKKKAEREAAETEREHWWKVAREAAAQRRRELEAKVELAKINADVHFYYPGRRSRVTSARDARIYKDAIAATVAWNRYVRDPVRYGRPPSYVAFHDREPSAAPPPPPKSPSPRRPTPPPPSAKKKAPDAVLQDELDDIVAKTRRSTDVAGKNRFFREMSRLVHPDKCRLAVDITRDEANRKLFAALAVDADIERFYGDFRSYVTALGDPERDAFCGDMQKRLLAVRS